MKAIILAAGVGRRLGVDQPKCLLEFNGKTLLRRHLEILAGCGIDEVTIGVGYKAAEIETALTDSDVGPRVQLVYNPDYAQGSIATLWSLRESLSARSGILLMDADVLYDKRLIARLLESRHRNCFLLDRDLEAGEEPVKLCVRNGRLVEFRKQVNITCDYFGESVGFFRLAGEMASKLTQVTARYLDEKRLDAPYEEALRDVLLAEPEHFGYEDITGLPWIEIDFAQDIDRAYAEILPQLLEHD
jgi:choline kinase